MRKFSTQEFIFAAQKVHSGVYDYSKTDYKGTHIELIIICKVHGQFIQRPNHHLHGHGCPTCAGNSPKTTCMFISAAQKLHENNYEYSKSVYISMHKKIVIVCKVHGEFLQTPHNHLNGQGCPFCKKSKGERQIAQILHNLKFEYQREVSFPRLLGNTMPLRFDFAVYQNNKLLCLVEYDGQQHFNYLKVFHASKEAFSLQKKYDNLKDEYCKRNNIKLIRISYKCKDIKNYLENNLCSN